MAPEASEEFTYDVPFSFAGEDRAYVERVAKAVEGQVRVFYDRYEQTDLWVETRADSGAPAVADARQAKGAPGQVEQVVQADGAKSEATVEGGMNIERRSGGDSRQEVKATNGGKAIVTGGMKYTGP